MSMKEKLAVTVLVTTLALFGLVVVLYRMIKDKNEDYTQIVLNQHSSYDSRTIPYRRGDIVDRNGTYLATSEKVYNLILDPNQINQDKENYLEPTVSALCEVFGYDRADILATISANENSYYVPYEKQISADKKEEFETKKKELNDAYAKSKEDSGKKIKGVWFEDEYRRFYPYNTLACNVVGFSYDNGKQGSGGIEQYYNDQLTGTNGREYGYLDDESNMEKVIKSAENGNTIVSTIDVNIQRIVEKYIDEWMSGIGSKTAAVIAMDPRNGEILAMSSNRRFDLNNPRDLSYAYSQEEITAMTDEGRMDAWNQMWRNFCVNDTYEPGSPAKPMTVAAGLEEGVISQNDTFLCGCWRLQDQMFQYLWTRNPDVGAVLNEILQRCYDADRGETRSTAVCKISEIIRHGSEDRNRSSGRGIWTDLQCGQYGPDRPCGKLLRTEL